MRKHNFRNAPQIQITKPNTEKLNQMNFNGNELRFNRISRGHYMWQMCSKHFSVTWKPLFL